MSTPPFTLQDTVGMYGDQRNAIQAMLDYDYVCGKENPALNWIIVPSLSSEQSSEVYFFGNKEVSIPLFRSLKRAQAEQPVHILVNFASARSAFAVTQEALGTSIEKIVVIAENMPEREARLLKVTANKTGKILIGPATVGGLISQVVKLGNAGGTMDNIVENRLFVRGSVGIVSKSGGMLNELMTMVARSTNGVAEAIAIGGDRFPFTTLVEQVQRFEENSDIKLILLLGEVGGTQELEIAQLVKEGRVKKPLVAWVSGTGAAVLKENIQFGHAGAMANGEDETSLNKLIALREAGIAVPDSFAQLENVLHEEAKKVGIGEMVNANQEQLLPDDFEKLMKKKALRYRKNMQSSISKKLGADESYFGHDIATTAQEKSLGYIMGLLWFKRELPDEVCAVLELILKVIADHGPSVSGAHNTIVTARAGKDLVSSLVSGLLTIGPRFGGAVNDAAHHFKWGADQGLSAFDFVAEMKTKGQPIPGIGHKVKSKTNPDKRVELLKKAAQSSSDQHTYLDYALKVEEVTTRKKDSLILNVDGVIAAMLLDIFQKYFTNDEIESFLKMEAFNAFFVLGRSIGLIGHFIDQKRLDQPLYRHPEWDILETD